MASRVELPIRVPRLSDDAVRKRMLGVQSVLKEVTAHPDWIGSGTKRNDLIVSAGKAPETHDDDYLKGQDIARHKLIQRKNALNGMLTVCNQALNRSRYTADDPHDAAFVSDSAYKNAVAKKKALLVTGTDFSKKKPELLQDLAAKGDVDAQMYLARAHEFGGHDGILVKSSMVAKYAEMAARSGRAEAQVDYARLCEHGIGVDQSYRKARYWYGRAADQGDVFGILHFRRIEALSPEVLREDLIRQPLMHGVTVF